MKYICIYSHFKPVQYQSQLRFFFTFIAFYCLCTYCSLFFYWCFLLPTLLLQCCKFPYGGTNKGTSYLLKCPSVFPKAQHNILKCVVWSTAQRYSVYCQRTKETWKHSHLRKNKKRQHNQCTLKIVSDYFNSGQLCYVSLVQPQRPSVTLTHSPWSVLVAGFQFSALITGKHTWPFSSMLGW